MCLPLLRLAALGQGFYTVGDIHSEQAISSGGNALYVAALFTMQCAALLELHQEGFYIVGHQNSQQCLSVVKCIVCVNM